jgi:hypothetical protein
MDRRVGYLEGAMKTMADNVTEVNSAVGALSQEMTRVVSGLGHEIGELREIVGQKIDTVTTRMTAAIERTTQETRTASKPNFLAIISIVGMTGALAAYILNGHNAEILSAKSDIKQAQADLVKAEFLRGQLDERSLETSRSLVAFVAHYDSQHKELDERLQRENKEQAAVVREQLVTVAAALQKETDNVGKRIEQQFADITAQLLDTRKRQLDRLDMYERQDLADVHDLARNGGSRSPATPKEAKASP